MSARLISKGLFHRIEQMAQLVLLRLEILDIALVGGHLNRHPFDDAWPLTIKPTTRADCSSAGECRTQVKGFAAMP